MKLEEYIQLCLSLLGPLERQESTTRLFYHQSHLSALTSTDLFSRHKEVSPSAVNSKMEFILLADNEKMNNPQQCSSFKFTTSALSGVISQTTLSAFKN